MNGQAVVRFGTAWRAHFLFAHGLLALTFGAELPTFAQMGSGEPRITMKRLASAGEKAATQLESGVAATFALPANNGLTLGRARRGIVDWGSQETVSSAGK